MQTGPNDSPRLAGRLLREPLLHFLLAGAVLFVVYAILSPAPKEDVRSGEIVITEEDLAQLAIGWRAQGRAAPSPAQLHGLVEARVREEVLYREALDMGMDKDDTIIRRRLAQKMEFLTEDASRIADPAPQVLRDWYTTRVDEFAQAPRMTLRHVYFSPDLRGDRARAAAAAALRQLEPAGIDARAGSIGDPVKYQTRHPGRPPEQLAAVFGPAFAEAVVAMPTQRWVGPVQSGYGWHLVYLEEVLPGRTPAFEEVEEAARQAWIAEQRAIGKQKAFEAMRARYKVVLPSAEAVANAVAVQPGVRK